MTMQFPKLTTMFTAVVLATAEAAVAAPGNGANADGHANASTSTSTQATTPAELAERSHRYAAAAETTETPE